MFLFLFPWCKDDELIKTAAINQKHSSFPKFLSRRNAFKLIKRLHPNIELDKYFTTQLYEYEPILQVQRSQLAGNSCSRELRCSLLKRKNRFDDNYTNHTDAVIPIRSIDYVDHFMGNIEQSTDILMEQWKRLHNWSPQFLMCKQ